LSENLRLDFALGHPVNAHGVPRRRDGAVVPRGAGGKRGGRGRIRAGPVRLATPSTCPPPLSLRRPFTSPLHRDCYLKLLRLSGRRRHLRHRTAPDEQ
jgi:hypothetical protein